MHQVVADVLRREPEKLELAVAWIKRFLADPEFSIHSKDDLAYSKLAARREKDLNFVRELLRHHLAGRGRLRRLIEVTEDAALRQELAGALEICLRGLHQDGKC